MFAEDALEAILEYQRLKKRLKRVQRIHEEFWSEKSMEEIERIKHEMVNVSGKFREAVGDMLD